MKRITILLAILTIGLSIQAQTRFTQDGLYYHVIDDSTCGIYACSTPICDIPPYVTYGENEYKVTAISGVWGSGSFCYYWLGDGYNIPNNWNNRYKLCSNSFITKIIIPYTVSEISYNAFNDLTALTEIVFNAKDASITHLYYTSHTDMFYGCTNLTTITIGDSVKRIPNNFLSNCTNITGIIIPDNVTEIGSQALKGCIGLSSVDLSDNLQTIGDSAFYGCTGFFSITLPDTLQIIGSRAFESCSNLYSLTIGRNVETIGDRAFINCTQLHNVTYNPRNANYLSDYYLFSGSDSISSLTIGNEVERIPKNFMTYKYKLHNVVFSEGLTHIGNHAFYNCGLQELVIPYTVTNIGQNAFHNNANLLRIVSLPENPPTIYQTTFSGVPTSIEKVVPCGTLEEYQIHPWWNGMANVKETCRYSSVYDTICSGEIYGYGTYTATVTGTYYDTIHIDPYVDSMTTIHLVVNPSYDYTFEEQICDGQSYIANGFNATTSGIYTQSLQSINGCDSIVRLNLTVNPVYDTTIEASICQGDNYTQYGFNTSIAGVYVQNLYTIAGCDSIMHLQLSANPIYSVHLSATISDMQSYQLGDSTLSQPGVYQKSLYTQAGCDSLLTLTLTVIPSIDTLVVHDTVYYPDTIIVVDTLFIHDTTIVQDTAIVIDTMVVYLDTLVIRDTVFISDTITPCPTYRTYIHASMEQGGTYTEYGFNVSAPGVYCDTIQTAEGCDSIICLFLMQSVGIDEVEDAQILSIYPNPTRTSLFLSIPEGNDDRLVKIIDNTGRTVISQTLISGENRIDVGVLSAGIYYVKVGKMTSKLIIQ